MSFVALFAEDLMIVALELALLLLLGWWVSQHWHKGTHEVAVGEGSPEGRPNDRRMK